MREKIKYFLDLFPGMTEEEANYIQAILDWDDETKLAFTMAKRIFEDKDNEQEEQ